MGILTKLIRRNNVFITLLLSFVAVIFGMINHLYPFAPVNNLLLLYIGSIGLFSCFDCYGYKYILTRFQTTDIRELHYDEYNAAYRIVQTTFQIVLALFLATFNFWLASFFVLSWWFGLCDFLFYVLLKEFNYMYNATNMSWLWWTPFGMLSQNLRNGKVLMASSIAIFILSVLSIILFC
jgi:phosphatidylglycerophosphatase A